MTAYYNEIDPYAAQWLRNLIEAGHIAPGEVDERSIVDVQPADLHGFTQCHFFAGIGGWSLAARLAGWPDDRELWTGSCPCQPFSVAGKQAGQSDERHLWPTFADLIAARRPRVVMGEQVAAAVGKHWLDGVHSDLEALGYSVGAAVVPACAVDAPHRRDRLWFVVDSHGVGSQPGNTAAESARHGSAPPANDRSGAMDNALVSRLERQPGDGEDGDEPRRQHPQSVGPATAAGSSAVGNAQSGMREERAGLGQASPECASRGSNGGALADADQPGESEWPEQRSGQFGRSRSNSRGSAWVGAEWLAGADGKARRFEPGIRLLAHGVPARVGKLRAYGNAIVPQVAAEIIGAYLDTLTPGEPNQ